MPRPFQLLVTALAVLAGACVTTETRTGPVAPAEAVSAAPAGAWAATDEAGALVGYVVRFTESKGATDAAGQARSFFSVRNPYQQELGLVDDLGRSWRFEAHQDEPTWLGSGSVAEASGRILGQPVELAEIDLQGLSNPSVPKN